MIDSGAVDIAHCFFQDPANNTPGPTHRKVLEVRPAIKSGHATFVAGIALGDDFNNLGAAAIAEMRGQHDWFPAVVEKESSMLSHQTMLRMRGFIPIAGMTIQMEPVILLCTIRRHPMPILLLGTMKIMLYWVPWEIMVRSKVLLERQRMRLALMLLNAIPNEMNVGDGNPGPTADGRRKPDVVTPGCNINSSQVSTTCTVQLSNVAPQAGQHLPQLQRLH